MKKEILIYQDDGVSAFSLQSLKKSLKREGIYNYFTIIEVKASHFQKEKWDQNVHLIIFPGGRDIPYHEALKGSLNASIHKFVVKGGRYLGICAGAYYASHFIEFEKGGPLEVIAYRELKFFPGTARGPAYGLGEFAYDSSKGARTAFLQLDTGQKARAYYNGGCLFVDADKYDNVHVLAYYDDIKEKSAAIIECLVGKGKALLVGCHPEYTLPREYEQARQALFRNLLIRLDCVDLSEIAL